MPKNTTPNTDPFALVNTGTTDDPQWEEAEQSDLWNFDEVAPPATIAPGEYNGVIISAEYKLSKSEQPMIEVYVRVRSDDDNNGFKVPGWLSFSEKAAWGTAQNLSIILGRTMSGRVNPRHLAREMEDKPVRVKVKVDPSDNGTGFPKVDRWLPTGTSVFPNRPSARSGSLI